MAHYILVVEKESGRQMLLFWSEKRRKEIKVFLGTSYWIIKVEPAVFQRLANDQFCNSNQCIVITVSNFLKVLTSFTTILLCMNSIFSQGRGYPDIPTRRCEKSLPLPLVIMLSSHMPACLLYCTIWTCLVACTVANVHAWYFFHFIHFVFSQVFAASGWEFAPACLLLGRLWSLWLWYLNHLQIWFNG